MSEQRTSRIGQERELPPPEDDPGMRATDDHAARSASGGAHQPTTRLDEGVGREHLSSASQGARPVETSADDLLDDEAAGGGPDGEEDSGSGPGFEGEDR